MNQICLIKFADKCYMVTSFKDISKLQRFFLEFKDKSWEL